MSFGECTCVNEWMEFELEINVWQQTALQKKLKKQWRKSEEGDEMRGEVGEKENVSISKG